MLYAKNPVFLNCIPHISSTKHWATIFRLPHPTRYPWFSISIPAIPTQKSLFLIPVIKIPSLHLHLCSSSPESCLSFCEHNISCPIVSFSLNFGFRHQTSFEEICQQFHYTKKPSLSSQFILFYIQKED